MPSAKLYWLPQSEAVRRIDQFLDFEMLGVAAFPAVTCLAHNHFALDRRHWSSLAESIEKAGFELDQLLGLVSAVQGHDTSGNLAL